MTAAIGIETFIVSGLPMLRPGVVKLARKHDVGAGYPVRVRELEDPLRARIARPVDRMAEAGRSVAGCMDRAGHLLGDGRGVGAGRRAPARLRAAARTPRRCRG